jgi:hypothetical protein
VDFGWELKERYPGQFVYKMTSINILGCNKKLENRLLGQRFYTVNVFELRSELHLRFVDNNDEFYMGDPIYSIGWKDNGNSIHLTTTDSARYEMKIVGGQGLKKTKSGLYEWVEKRE